MTVFDYTRSRGTAERLLGKFGAAGAIRRAVFTPNPDTPWDPSSGTTTVTDYPATMVVLSYANSEVDGTLIQQTDKRVLVSTKGLAITPATTDTLVTPDDQALSMVNVSPLKPAATVVLYELQARA